MALNVTYFRNSDPVTRVCYDRVLGSASYTVTGSSASVGTVPSGSNLARLAAGENCWVSNNGTAASTTNGVYIPAGSVVDISVQEQTPLLAITG